MRIIYDAFYFYCQKSRQKENKPAQGIFHNPPHRRDSRQKTKSGKKLQFAVVISFAEKNIYKKRENNR